MFCLCSPVLCYCNVFFTKHVTLDYCEADDLRTAIYVSVSYYIRFSIRISFYQIDH